MRNAPARVSAPAAGVEEEVGAVAPIEVGPPEREVAPQRLGCRPSERDDALLAALPEHADDTVVEVDRASCEPDRLRDAEPRAVEELHERPVAHRAWGRAVGRVDEALGLGRGQRPRQRPGPPRGRDLRGGVLASPAEEHEVPEVRAHGREASRDRRGGESVGAHRREPGLELRRRRVAGRAVAERRERDEVAAIGVHRARRPPCGEQQQVALEVGVGGPRRHERDPIRRRGARSCAASGTRAAETRRCRSHPEPPPTRGVRILAVRRAQLCVDSRPGS